jgi:hypothetical protein
MSSQQQEAPSAPKEQKEKKGLGKFLSRAKTVLKRGEGSSKRFSTMSAQAGAPSKPAEAKRYVKVMSSAAFQTLVFTRSYTAKREAVDYTREHWS